MESRRLGAWSEGKEIKTSFSLQFIVTLNLHNKSRPKRFAGEQSETKKA